MTQGKKTKHKIVPTPPYVGGHNGEYYHHCTECGASDWIARYGTFDQLDFYSTPCLPTKAGKPL